MFFDNSVSKILNINLDSGLTNIIDFPGREQHIGGSGLVAALYQKYGFVDKNALDPCQPLIFAIGPLTGFFPVMTKVVFGFRSPYTNEWAESHAGGRLGLSIRFAGYDAIMITGKAKSLTALVISSLGVDIHDVHFLAGKDVFTTGKFMRRYGTGFSGHRSTVRIGPAGENLVSYACTNVDTFRHFGRLGSGAALGAKNIKAFVVVGDQKVEIPKSKDYPKLYKKLFIDLTATKMMQKYHNLGTPQNLLPLNELKALPWCNLKKTSDIAVENISGEYFAEQLLMRKIACAGCPIGCVHLALLKEKFSDEHDYVYKQVSYDYELIFAQGTMLGIKNAQDIVRVLDETEKLGLDCMSSGVVLAWCTEALERGIISVKETLENLEFGDANKYIIALRHIVKGSNEFWKAVARGTNYVAKLYGGEDFSCSLGQEMAGYATGEIFFVAQSLGFRHSHLDTGAYSFDQTNTDKNLVKAIDFLIKDEAERCGLTSLVACLFARKAYTPESCMQALDCLGMNKEADNFLNSNKKIQRARWQLKFATGFVPENSKISKRFTEVINWKGKIDEEFMNQLKTAYSKKIREMASL